MSVHVEITPTGTKRYRGRWREGDRQRSTSFTRKRDAEAYDAEVDRRKRLGPVSLALLDAGEESLDEYVSSTWAPAHAAHLAPATRRLYADAYDAHIGPFLGTIPLRELTRTASRPGRPSGWQRAPVVRRFESRTRCSATSSSARSSPSGSR
ncbi:hypothetical protein DSM112329_00289 [Paraconexibacter sp. AEG42_29]|uniref:Core-binding (CB) domain-containing protein n=1 Tax=Paraconexibacter sp. AEG42_29 TaxID=2997339 RepID=A0AAU7AQ29_9ACTN